MLTSILDFSHWLKKKNPKSQKKKKEKERKERRRKGRKPVREGGKDGGRKET